MDSPLAQVRLATTPCRPKQPQRAEPDGNAPTSSAAALLVPPPARCIWAHRPQVPTPASEQAGSSQSGNAGSAPTLSTQISLLNYQPVNSAGSAVEALETDGTTTGAEDLRWRTQHNAINPYAKQTCPRERAKTPKIRPSMLEH
jgi:hypothetical protein